MNHVLLDFSHTYPAGIEKQFKNMQRIDLSDIPGTNMYCTKEAMTIIQKRLSNISYAGIHFLDNGNYHYMTAFFTAKIREPYVLVLFDHHSDMQQPLIHDLMSCGSWAGELLREDPHLVQLILIGPSAKTIQEIDPALKKKVVCISINEIEEDCAQAEISHIRMDLPAYISIDKDVLDRYSARTNWDQGNMSIRTLEHLLRLVFSKQRVLGVDICGEGALDEDWWEKAEDEKINATTDQILYYYLSRALEREKRSQTAR